MSPFLPLFVLCLALVSSCAHLVPGEDEEVLAPAFELSELTIANGVRVGTKVGEPRTIVAFAHFGAEVKSLLVRCEPESGLIGPDGYCDQSMERLLPSQWSLDARDWTIYSCETGSKRPPPARDTAYFCGLYGFFEDPSAHSIEEPRRIYFHTAK